MVDNETDCVLVSRAVGVPSTDAGVLSTDAADRPLRGRVLDSTRTCLERWGSARTTVDDIAKHSGVSRATIYRLFPGGRTVLFEELRLRELELFFDDLKSAVTDAATLTDLIVDTVVTATRRLRDDEHLALMLAAEPGTVLSELTSAGVPNIVEYASAFLGPFVAPYVGDERARIVIDVLARLTISYFLAPSELIDLGDERAARALLTPLVAAVAEPAVTPLTVLPATTPGAI